MKKILVACPIYSGMNYCFKEFIDAVKKIDYENYDILLMDNSRENDFFDKISEEKGIKILKDETQEEKNKLRLISSRNKIINYALENNCKKFQKENFNTPDKEVSPFGVLFEKDEVSKRTYDYILMLDADVIVPSNIIKELLEDDKDIVSGLYYNHFKIDGQIKYRPVCWCDLTDEEFEDIKKQLNLPSIVKSSVDLRRFMTQEESESNELIKVKIASAGCMLIKRKVFSEIKYGLLTVPEKYSTGDDIYFFTKAREKDFEIFCNTKIKCKHLTYGKYKKDEEGNLINPLHL